MSVSRHDSRRARTLEPPPRTRAGAPSRRRRIDPALGQLTSLQMVRLHANQLEQLASMTTLSIDTGDLDILAEFASTGLITDATTNPLFVSQAGQSGDPRYQAFVAEACVHVPF